MHLLAKLCVVLNLSLMTQSRAYFLDYIVGALKDFDASK